MAKSPKPKKVECWYYSSKLDKSLLLSPKFTYEVEMYKVAGNCYNLEDSKYITHSTFLKDDTEYITKDGICFKRLQRLIAAPEKWLKDNNYTIKQ